MSDEEHHFESSDAGASKTYPQQAGNIRKGGHIVIKGRPCKVVEVSTSKTGKHGHAKCHFVAIDIFTAKKLEDIVPSSHNCDVPHVNRIDYQLIDISEDGFVSLLTDSGGTKDDLKLPTDDNLSALMKSGFEEGKDVVVSVMSSMGEEQICAVKEVGGGNSWVKKEDSKSKIGCKPLEEFLCCRLPCRVSLREFGSSTSIYPIGMLYSTFSSNVQDLLHISSPTSLLQVHPTSDLDVAKQSAAPSLLSASLQTSNVKGAVLVGLAFSVALANSIIICNTAGVVSVLEVISGAGALVRASDMIKEQVEVVMDEGRQKDLQLLEEIIDKGLKQKLLQTIASRSDLRKNLETLEKNGVNSLKTMVNLGSEVYMQAEVLDTRHIFMDVGLGFYVEFTRQEALDYIPKREELVKKQLEEVTKVIAQIKGRIKLAHHQIQQILNLPDENPSSHRQPVMDPAQNKSAAGIGGSNGTTTMGYQTNDGTATASEDSKENLNQVINSIQKTLGLLHQLHLTVSSFTPASQLHLLQRLNSLVSELNSMTKLSEKCNIQVPMEVLSLIDDGKNPDEFTRDVINSCVARNQVTKGKTDAFKDLRKHILEELEETFPDEVDKYREIRAASAAISIEFSRRERKMSEVFEGYERQYCELSTNLSRKCHSASLLSHGEEKKEKLVEIKSGMDEADVLIRKMDLEARSLQPSAKAVCLSKLREYKSDLNQLKKEFKRVSSPDANQSTREELMESGMADVHAVSADQSGRLAMSMERLDQSSDRIRESRRLMLETEEVGISVVENLSQQRQTLLHAHSKLQGVDDAIDKSKKVLTAMSRRMTRNKWIVGSVIVALILAIILIISYKLSH
uniref:Translation initiation factor 5A C-terminal domain-containing protein n=1 Tax=Brassica oleracea var. oleracea TaxID=109376 RepID=A0A0D3D6U2_BRAOL